MLPEGVIGADRKAPHSRIVNPVDFHPVPLEMMRLMDRIFRLCL